MVLNKISNTYAKAAGNDVFEAAPKAVWAALAVSALTSGGDALDDARALVLREWQILHRAGIVPQAPPKKLLATIAPEEE